MDKRKTKTETEPNGSEETSSAAPPARSGKPSLSAPLGGDAASSESPELDHGSIPAQDAAASPDSPAGGASSAAGGAQDQGVGGGARDYLDDLRRVQAEFDNFRKRTFRERQQLEARGRRQIVEHLLPVLDNFERAIAHGEGGGGVELVIKELKTSLEREGLAEIEAEGKPFDPTVHEAVESVEDPDVEHATVTQVYRHGYTFGGDVVRPAMVVVARPVERAADDAEVAEAEGA